MENGTSTAFPGFRICGGKTKFKCELTVTLTKFRDEHKKCSKMLQNSIQHTPLKLFKTSNKLVGAAAPYSAQPLLICSRCECHAPLLLCFHPQAHNNRNQCMLRVKLLWLKCGITPTTYAATRSNSHSCHRNRRPKRLQLLSNALQRRHPKALTKLRLIPC